MYYFSFIDEEYLHFHTVSSEKLLVYKNNNENEVNRNINGGERFTGHQSAQSRLDCKPPLSHKCSLMCWNGKMRTVIQLMYRVYHSDELK